MKKLIVFLTVVCLCAAIPSISFTEDRATVRLARTIYALTGNESYETKLAIGTVVMNRVESPWYPGELADVLSQQHQFPSASSCDFESLRAAHAVISGNRALGAQAIAFQPKDASAPRGEDDKCAESGNYNFYSTERR